MYRVAYYLFFIIFADDSCVIEDKIIIIMQVVFRVHGTCFLQLVHWFGNMDKRSLRLRLQVYTKDHILIL